MDDLSTENFSKATLPNEWHDIKEGDDFPESRFVSTTQIQQLFIGLGIS